jgi:hypothetical protein
MANTSKSWKGAPTVNIVSTLPENYVGWSGAGWWIHPGNTVSSDIGVKPDGSSGLIFNATTLASGGLYGYSGYSLSAAYVVGSAYTISFWARNYNGTASIYVRDSDSGARTLSWTVTGVTGDWQRFSLTWVATSVSIMLTFTGNNFSLWGVQLEISNFVTPYVNGSRSTTQSIVDVSNHLTLTTDGITFNSDGSFAFANGIINTNLSAQTIPTLTVEAMIYDTKGSGYRAILQNNTNTDDALYIFPSNQLGFWPDNPSSFVIQPNTWTYIAASFDGTNTIFCVNGIFQTIAGSSAHISDFQFMRVGGISNTDPERFGGNIPMMRFYNRALSSAELTRNFNATRGRYGI